MANLTGDTGGGSPANTVSMGQWAVAYAALWFVLIMFVDFGSTAEFAAALAALIAISATVAWLPQALANFQKGVGA